MDRARQLHELFGIAFPDELFAFWDWYTGLGAELRQTFVDHARMVPCGVCDVLAGKLDGVQLRYPAVLHWRYRLDPPEFITVLSGDTDGLHWGFWFDDPNEAPVIVGNYARDAYEFWVAGYSLFEMIERQIVESIEANEEHLEGDTKHADNYRRYIAALKQLAKQVPAGKPARAKRLPTRTTTDRMGIVVPRASWDAMLAADPIDRAEALERCTRWIAEGKAGVALYHGKQLWPVDHDLACQILEPAYRALGRDALAAITHAHREHPGLPNVNILSYKIGDYSSLDDARAAPLAVEKLVLGGERLKTAPDLSAMVNLRELELWGNELTTLPPSLAACKALQRVNLYRNPLREFPEVLAQLQALIELQLGFNQISRIPDAIAGCRALKRLDLANSPVTAISETLGALPLESLNLPNTRLASLPETLGTCASLRFLAVTGSPLATLPRDLSGWCDLQRIAVKNTQLPAHELERLRAAAPNAQIIA